MKQAKNTFVPCGHVTVRDLTAQAGRFPQHRLGVKAIFFEPMKLEPRVLLGKLPAGYPNRFNLPGGGVDTGEDLATALLRELFEEFGQFDLTSEQVKRSPVVAEGKLPFPREGYQGKYEYLVAISFAGLHTLVPKADAKIVLFQAMAWHRAAKMIWDDTHVELDQRVLYAEAFEAIPRAALLAA